MDIARKESKTAVRVAAFLILHQDARSPRTRDFLQRAGERIKDMPAARNAAIEALSPVLSEQRVAWLHLAFYGGATRDPL